MSEPLEELRERLLQAADALRAGAVEPRMALELIEECSRLASEAASAVDTHVRAVLEPLPDLPGQLPLPAAP